MSSNSSRVHLESLALRLQTKHHSISLSWEDSESLAWIIASLNKKRIAITFLAGAYNSTPLENYEGIGYLQPLNRDKTEEEAVESISTYLEEGYEQAFSSMLEKRANSKKEEFFTMDQVKERINRTIEENKKRIGGFGKSPSLEFPPSLAKEIAYKQLPGYEF
jgi:hypothetical protein